MNAVLLLLVVSMAIGVRSVTTDRPIRHSLILAVSCVCVLALYSHRVVN